jgi:putative glutamine transport system substrate-binding protein
MATKLRILFVLLLAIGLTSCGTAPLTPDATRPTAGAPTIVATLLQGTGGLEEIKQRGKVKVGVKYDLPLFGYLDPETNHVQGFDVDMARALAEHIFGDPEAVEFTEAVVKNRIPYLNEGVVDVVFATMITSEERAQQVDFSDCYYVAGQTLLVPASSQIATLHDLDGKRVSAVKGSASEENIRRLAPGAQLQLFDTDADAFEALQAGVVDATTSTDVVLLGFQKRTADKYEMVGGRLAPIAYAAGIRKGNESLLNEVNQVIRDLKQTGRWAEIYRRWISNDVPSVPPEDWRTVYAQP